MTNATLEHCNDLNLRATELYKDANVLGAHIQQVQKRITSLCNRAAALNEEASKLRNQELKRLSPDVDGVRQTQLIFGWGEAEEKKDSPDDHQ